VESLVLLAVVGVLFVAGICIVVRWMNKDTSQMTPEAAEEHKRLVKRVDIGLTVAAVGSAVLAYLSEKHVSSAAKWPTQDGAAERERQRLRIQQDALRLQQQQLQQQIAQQNRYTPMAPPALPPTSDPRYWIPRLWNK
jgi:flagellar basal body-associated protein FliL